MSKKYVVMDGNTAAAYTAYAFTEVAAIYPITPSSPMAEKVDEWSAKGKKNLFGTTVDITQMQSEAGAAGACHGSLQAGALTTTFTSSQGLMLMIPAMYAMGGQFLPSVMHIASRVVTSNHHSIFGDHTDFMTCRTTGYAMLMSSSPQEAMDLAAVAHLSAIKAGYAFMHCFDGFRTSHEMQRIEALDYEDLRPLMDTEALDAFRHKSLNPEHPTNRGNNVNPDIYFQCKEGANVKAAVVPETVQHYMDEINKITGRDYKLFNYYGAEDAEEVIVVMCSASEAVKETVDFLNANGRKVGLVQIHLYRPFSVEHFAAAIPASCKKIAVLDRTKEPGALGDPLYLDVATTLREAGLNDIVLTAGRYGLGSKDTPPSSVFAIYKELEKDAPKSRFTIGIVDDVTNLSLPEVKPAPITSAPGTVECKFWGLGGDGTVGANKNSTKIIGDHTDKYIQAYFQYDSKKTGGITISHLRFGDNPIRSPYYINQADFVACHNPSYVVKGYKMVQDVKPGGIFMINCQWSDEELDHHMPAAAKKYIADNNIQLYTINAIDKAIEIGMGKRTNTILQSAFFKLANIMPIDEAVEFMKAAAKKSYSKKGDAVVEMNYKAIDAGVDAVHKVEIPASWSNPAPDAPAKELVGRPETVKMVKEMMEPIGIMDGDSLPVSTFVDNADGQFELGASAYEKRGTAVSVPEWNPEACIQCNQCAFVCSHATIRPFLVSEDEIKAAPDNMKVADMKPKAGAYKYTMSVSPLDCMGCGECITVCPAAAKGALKMVPQESQAAEQPVFDYLVATVGRKPGAPADTTVKGSQFNQPLLEFSGSCAGCAETSYARLITQLFGEQMYISNATGCSSIWGGPAATAPYTVNKDSKQGPAWANSLFEDNAEHGFGMYLGQKTLRNQAIAKLEKMAASDKATDEFKAAFAKFMETKENTKTGETKRKSDLREYR